MSLIGRCPYSRRSKYTESIGKSSFGANKKKLVLYIEAFILCPCYRVSFIREVPLYMATTV